MVEELAARLLRRGLATVDTRVSLPSKGKYPREVDILVTIPMPSGQVIQYAVECKNERAPIETEYIDAFCGKLNHLGIATENGIFVSRSRYRKGALDRAKLAGIRTLRIAGLRDNGLEDLIYSAIQSVVWLLLSVKQIEIRNEATEGSLMFCDAKGQFVGMVNDLIHRAWLGGSVPLEIGRHEVAVAIPDHWMSMSSNGPAKVSDVSVIVAISGIVYSVHGEATYHALVTSPEETVDRSELNARWDESKHRIEITRLFTGEQLAAHLNGQVSLLNVVVHNRQLPRIEINGQIGRMYWPPTEDVAKMLHARFSAGLPVGSPGEDFEGNNFARFFSEPAPFHKPRWEPESDAL